MAFPFRTFCAAVLALGLSACGFHLRGQGQVGPALPFSTVYVENPSGSAVAPLLSRSLSLQKGVSVMSDVRAADTVLSVLSEQQAKDLLTLNRAGRVNEYQLTYRVSVQLKKNNQAFGEPVTVWVRRDFPYSDSSVLGKEQEEQLVWRMMREEATTLLMYRLPAVKAVSRP